MSESFGQSERERAREIEEGERGGERWRESRAVANGPVGPAMAGPIIEPVIFFFLYIFFFFKLIFFRPDQ